MSKKVSSTGSCLCGAVKINAEEIDPKLGACHCSMCRRWSAGPFMTVDCGTNVTIEGDKDLGLFNSSDWAERGFCKQCGSNLFYRLKGKLHYFMSRDIFDDLEGLVFDHQVFIDEKPDSYEFKNQTHNMTGAEIFAMHSGDNK